MHTKKTKRPKTGGRQKGSGGVRVFLTIPKETAAKMPSNAKELKGAALDAIVGKYSVEAMEKANAGFVPRASDISYMENSDQFPDLPDRQQ